MPSNAAVPVTMGSPRFRTQDVKSCVVHLVSFPAATVLHAHYHDRPTFAVILTGGFELRFTNPAIRRAYLSCPPGTVLTQPAHERHANHIAPGGARGVVLQPDLTRAELPRCCAQLLDRINHFRDEPIAARARGLARELIAPDEVTPLALEGLALEMLAEAARLDARRDLGRAEVTPWLRRAIEFVHANFRQSLRIGDIAAAAEIQPARLAAHFRRLHRVPIGSYVRRLRLDWAIDQLTATALPIARIAVEAGYTDQAHLTRAFKRATGSTPAAYRQARRRGRAAVEVR
jgi:AraC family transcriptional regulator